MSEGLQAEMTLQESCLEAMRHMSVEVTALIDKTNELEDNNAKLKRAAERDADVLESLNLSLEESQAENAKLRDELAKWERLAAGIELPEYPVTQFEPKDLERENEKLRELVRDMWNGMCARAECRHCEHYELKDGQRFVGQCEFHRRMRELGIEVPEWADHQ